MNKDVIYIEPEDDITDIITKIEKAKEKIVALVPPKKAGVFRSIVNIKLIAKAGATAEKTVVLVTVDPSITKLAAATKLPVAKNLQSAPVIPEVETEDEPAEQTIEDMPEEEETVDEDADDAPEVEQGSSSPEKASKKAVEAEEEDEEPEDEEEEEKPLKKAKKGKKGPKLSGNKFLDWFKLHKKLSIAGGACLVAIIAFLIWAFGFAPAVDITVAIKTDSRNFSETVNFVTNATDENAKEGKLYLEQKKYENTQEVEFTATGEKNQGEKAIGEVVVYINARNRSDTGSVSAGDVFTYNGLRYVATSGTSITWNNDICTKQLSEEDSFFDTGCTLQGTIKVEATNPGEKYNVAASSSGWTTLANVSGARADKPITGGTDKVVTVVQQSDVIKAEEQLTTAKESENKQKLYDSISDDYYIIEVSFEQSTSNATATPGVDQEVGSGVTPKLSATTTATVYVVEKSKVEEYIKAKAELEDGQRIYKIKDMYVESFAASGSGFTGRLKAQYYVGPKVTETEVVDKIKGKGLGDAQREIRDLYGVSDVTINPSYPWVMAVPGDSNKVKVTFEVKDQDGNEVQESSDDDSSDSSSSSSDKKDEK